MFRFELSQSDHVMPQDGPASLRLYRSPGKCYNPPEKGRARAHPALFPSDNTFIHRRQHSERSFDFGYRSCIQ